MSLLTEILLKSPIEKLVLSEVEWIANLNCLAPLAQLAEQVTLNNGVLG
jgi:hypothetical protein